MSASICWEKVEPSPNTLSTWAPSGFIETAEKVFGKLPYEFGDKDMERVRTLAALETGRNTPWQELSDLISAHGKIRVWAEY